MHFGFITSAANWSRRQLLGFSRYIGEHPDIRWSRIPFVDRELKAFPADLDVVAGALYGEEIDWVEARGIRVVNSSLRHLDTCRYGVFVDYQVLGGQLAAHLVDRGIPALAAYRVDPGVYSNLVSLFDACLSEASRAGIRVVDTLVERMEGPGARTRIDQRLKRLADWVRELPSHVAVLGGDDEMALRVMTAARMVGKRIPGPLNVIGVDNDRVLCETARPRLTSLDLNHEEKGYQLARMCRIALVEEGSHLQWVEPRGIIPRESTGLGAPDDEQVQLALSALREWEYEPPTLDEVAKRAGLPPRTLQRRVTAQLGTSPSGILSRVRLEKALALLRDTRLPLAEITDRIGYSLPSQLSRAVKQATGLSPREYRERWRWAVDES